jgi:AcrR family transcriptional regulator
MTNSTLKRPARAGTVKSLMRPPRLKERPQVDLDPRGELRAERFLEAATDVFLEKGYRCAKLTDIVSRAGGSLETLYKVFGDKEGLAHAIMEARLAFFNEMIEKVSATSKHPAEGLHTLADYLVDAFLTREMLAIHRIVVGEGQALPELRDWYFSHVVEPVNARLGAYLQAEVKAGRLVLDDPQLAAEQFVMLVCGTLVFFPAIGLRTFEVDQAKAQAHHAVKLFIRAALP